MSAAYSSHSEFHKKEGLKFMLVRPKILNSCSFQQSCPVIEPQSYKKQELTLIGLIFLFTLQDNSCWLKADFRLNITIGMPNHADILF